MRLLPKEMINISQGCGEKINSYLLLSGYGFPVLKSVYVPRSELELWGEEDENKVRVYLDNDHSMLRYLYRGACHNIKDGGAIVAISRNDIRSQVPEQADVWLLEPMVRTENRCCFNFSIDLDMQDLHIELLGEGFDISDLNKGVISPHEVIDIPFPLVNGYYGEWWKWANIRICTPMEYQDSVAIRKARLKKMGYEIALPKEFTPVSLELLERSRDHLCRIQPWILKNRPRFVNISCSVLRSNRFIFWDIQTPVGKYKAYL